MYRRVEESAKCRQCSRGVDGCYRHLDCAGSHNNLVLRRTQPPFSLKESGNQKVAARDLPITLDFELPPLLTYSGIPLRRLMSCPYGTEGSAKRLPRFPSSPPLSSVPAISLLTARFMRSCSPLAFFPLLTYSASLTISRSPLMTYVIAHLVAYCC